MGAASATLAVFGVAFAVPAAAELKVTSPDFAAYALSDKRRLAWSFGQRNKDEAKQNALRQCGEGCKVIMEIHAKCIAYAESHENGYWNGFAGAPNRQKAQ